MGLIQTRGSRHWREDISSMAMPNISITSVEINGSLAYVNYSIEAVEGGYADITLVAKKNSAPTSKTDGVTATITQSSTGKLMYLNNSSTYYFAIFAEYNGYTFRTPAVSYNTQSEITFCNTEIRDGVMYNIITNSTFIPRGTSTLPTVGYDSGKSAVSIKFPNGTWCNIDTGGKWSNSREKLSSITMECEVYMPSSSYKFEYVINFLTRLNLTGSSPAVTIAQNSTNYKIYWTPPLNNKLNAFHKVKMIIYYHNSGKAYKCELYVDNTLYNQTTFSDVADTSNFASLALTGTANLTMYVKSLKLTGVYYDT